MTKLKQKEYTVELNTGSGVSWYYRDYTSTCDPFKKAPEAERNWHIAYMKRDTSGAIENIHFAHLEQYLQFTDILEEAGYSYRELT